MAPDKYDELIMELVVEGGNARSLAMEAIQAAKVGQFDKAEERLKESEQALMEAHISQTDMIQAEIQGNSFPVKLLMVHAQDHLMDAIVVRDLAKEIVELYKKLITN